RNETLWPISSSRKSRWRSGRTSIRWPSGLAGRLRGHLIDVRPLRHRDFRLLEIGQSVSFLGSMITYVALPFQVYELTGSSLQVGLLGLVELVPILIMAFVGGALA